MANNFFTLCSFFYSLMLTIIYFKRKFATGGRFFSKGITKDKNFSKEENNKVNVKNKNRDFR